MFKRFSVQTSTKLVKNPKPSKTQSDAPVPPPIDYAEIAEKVGENVIVAAVSVIGTYVVLDTVRQVTVAIVKAKFH